MDATSAQHRPFRCAQREEGISCQAYLTLMFFFPWHILHRASLLSQVYYCPCKSASKQRPLTAFRINTYEKQGGCYNLRNSYNPMLTQRLAAREVLEFAESFHAPARQKRQEAQLP